MRLIVGISGASGVLMGLRLLEELKRHQGVEAHVVITEAAWRNFELETQADRETIYALADYVHSNDNLGAVIASGSFRTDGMVVIPCSMKTLSAIANGYDSNLLVRAADVCLKEGRKVVLVPREMPLGASHIRNMALALDGGCCVMPPMLTFYNHADTLEQQVDHVVGKILLQFGLEPARFKPWKGDECDA